MKSVEILSCDGILTQINAMLLIARVQFAALPFVHKLIIDCLYFQRLTFFIIYHKIEGWNLIGYRVA